MPTPASSPASGMGKPETPMDFPSLAGFLEAMVSIQPDFPNMSPGEYCQVRAGMHDSLHMIFALRDTPKTDDDDGHMKCPLFNNMREVPGLSGEAIRGVHMLLLRAWLSLFTTVPDLRSALERMKNGPTPEQFKNQKRDLQEAFTDCELALTMLRLHLAVPAPVLAESKSVVVEVSGRTARALLDDPPK